MRLSSVSGVLPVGQHTLLNFQHCDGSLHVAQQSPGQLPAGVPAYVLGTRGGQSVAGWSVHDANWVVVVEATTPALRAAAIDEVVQAAVSSVRAGI